MDTFQKQPADVVDINIDLSGYLPTSDTISSAIPSLQDAADGLLVLGVTTINNTTKIVTQWVSVGTSGQTYHVKVLVTSVAGRVKEVDFKIKVKEI